MTDGDVWLTLDSVDDWPPEGTPAPADRTLRLLEHERIDPESDELLAALITGLAVTKQRAALVAYGDPDAGIDSWQVLTDPAVAPLWALPHAAQYTGGTMPPRDPGEGDEAYLARARAAVVFPQGMRRGGRGAIDRAVRPHLIGSRNVVVIERAGGSLYHVTIRTRTSETLDPARVELALKGDRVSGGRVGAVAAGIKVTYVLSDAPLIDEGTRLIDDVPVVIDDVVIDDVT